MKYCEYCGGIIDANEDEEICDKCYAKIQAQEQDEIRKECMEADELKDET